MSRQHISTSQVTGTCARTARRVAGPQYADCAEGGKGVSHVDRHAPEAMKALFAEYGPQLEGFRTLSIEMGPFGMLQSRLNVAGLSPSWFFRYLTRAISGHSHLEIMLNVAAVVLAALPASSLALVATALLGGAVIRAIGVKA